MALKNRGTARQMFYLLLVMTAMLAVMSLLGRHRDDVVARGRLSWPTPPSLGR